MKNFIGHFDGGQREKGEISWKVSLCFPAQTNLHKSTSPWNSKWATPGQKQMSGKDEGKGMKAWWAVNVIYCPHSHQAMHRLQLKLLWCFGSLSHKAKPEITESQTGLGLKGTLNLIPFHPCRGRDCPTVPGCPGTLQGCRGSPSWGLQ